MNFKEFGENALIEYHLRVYVNDEEVCTIVALDQESLVEQLRKADHAVNDYLTEEYEALPEVNDED